MRKNRYQYFDIGGGCVVRADELVGVFDLDNTTVAKSTREFLSARETAGRVTNVASDIPVSFVLCSSSDAKASLDDSRVYLSQYAPRSMGARRIVK